MPLADCFLLHQHAQGEARDVCGRDKLFDFSPSQALITFTRSLSHIHNRQLRMLINNLFESLTHTSSARDIIFHGHKGT